GMAAHEVSHLMYNAVIKAQEWEHESIEALPPEEKHRLFKAHTAADGEVTISHAKPEAVEELSATYPASAAWASTWGDRYLTVGEPGQQSMINENGHSAYARAYWA